MVKIIVLNDNRTSNSFCKSEHGLSLYIEIGNHKLLMDLGQSDVFKQNAEKLSINLNNIDTIVLSHGHYDHTRGLKYISKGIRLICHPESCIYRYSTRTKQYGGIDYTKEELAESFDLIMSKNPYEIYENVYFLGEVPRENSFEATKFPMTLKDGSVDIVTDDSGIVIDTKDGLIIISGCAHSGICNTIEYAKQIMNKSKILAVIGGFHLTEVDNVTKETIEYFKKNDINNIILAHCTSDEVCEYFKNALNSKTKVEVLGSGSIYEMDNK